ncbi:hypothetical protein [Paraburkholderia sp. Cpub6]|uniref:hypothetical protein n=1 Tax=Paraburkholderia sp. Cpub6 TaxID=2723094 RepID=UPI00160F387B|nr:hypothetical protein [Paraburkholderia sp. Cpub6]MBB5460167.1 hypothetical protein [Paraburkholderia sp. Cpub6]
MVKMDNAIAGEMSASCVSVYRVARTACNREPTDCTEPLSRPSGEPITAQHAFSEAGTVSAGRLIVEIRPQFAHVGDEFVINSPV